MVIFHSFSHGLPGRKTMFSPWVFPWENLRPRCYRNPSPPRLMQSVTKVKHEEKPEEVMGRGEGGKGGRGEGGQETMEKSGIWPKLEDFFGDFLVKIQDMSFFFCEVVFFCSDVTARCCGLTGGWYFFSRSFLGSGSVLEEKTLLLDQRLDGHLRYSKDWDSRKRRMIYASSQVCI